MKRPLHPQVPAFTLVEVLVSATIFVVILGFMLTVSDQTARIMRSTTGKVEQFREARTGFERITTRLSQATLNTYWDYDSATLPTRYERRSELRFVSGQAAALLGNSGTKTRLTHCVFFNAPLGLAATAADSALANALNTVGYFVEFADDSALRPAFITSAIVPPKWRWRLMEFAQPTEQFNLYTYTSGATGGVANSRTYNQTMWFNNAVNAGGFSRVLAGNVVALIFTPRLSKAEELPLQAGSPDLSPLAPNYAYDSTTAVANPALNPKSQLPPIIQVTMVAIDEGSADRLSLDSTKANLLGVATKFANTANFTSDLSIDSTATNSLEKTLVRLKARYRIFTTNVHIRGAKWSRDQAN